MNCRNCTRDTLSEFGDLSLERFLYIIKQFPFLQKVKLQGLGEPLLNRALFEMAAFLKKKRISTYIATNATLLNQASAQDLVRYFDQIEVSIDSAQPALLRKIRGKDCLDDVLRGVKLLRSVNRESELAINFVLEKNNAGQLKDIVNLANSLKIHHINVIGLQNWITNESRHQDKASEILKRRVETDNGIDNRLREAKELAGYFNIYLDVSVSDGKQAGCFWYKKGVYISWNGYVSPCCLRPNYQEFNFGNVFEKDIRDIWNSPDYIKFRQDLGSGNVPSTCKGCNYAA
jgi:radical SAM protein with 4Fe4S-binding SPASM domain